MNGVAIGYCHPSEVASLFCSSLTGALVADGQRGDTGDSRTIASVISVASGPRVAHARNEIVRTFLDTTTAEWLLMVDADVVFNLSHIDRVLAQADRSKRPVVSGLYFGGGRSGTMFPLIYRLARWEGEAEPPEDWTPVEVVEDYPEGLCRCDAVGAGFLLMHRKVLERMGNRYGDPAPWFLEGSVYRGLSFGEDWAFCMRLKEMGIELYIDTSIVVGHVKPMVLDADAYLRYRAERDEAGGDDALVTKFALKFTNEGDAVEHSGSVSRLEAVG